MEFAARLVDWIEEIEKPGGSLIWTRQEEVPVDDDKPENKPRIAHIIFRQLYLQ